MHPTLFYEIARYRQADLLREAEQARLAKLATRVRRATALVPARGCTCAPAVAACPRR